MQDPSEEMLDRHFRQQVARFHDVDYYKACPSDRLIMAGWMKVFEAAPLNQKLARNGLMLLIHAHIKDFGNLRAPFTDVRNCKKDLNELLDSYRGFPETSFKDCSDNSPLLNSQETIPSAPLSKKQPRLMAGIPTTRSRALSLKRTNTTSQAHRMQFQPRHLAPITEDTEDTEPSEMDPSTGKHGASLIGEKSFGKKSPGESSGTIRTYLCSSPARTQNNQSVRQKISIFEKENIEENKRLWKKSSSRATTNVKLGAHSNEVMTRRATCSKLPLPEQDHRANHIQTHLPRRSSAVRNLKSCFQEMAERFRDRSENKQKPFEAKAPASAPPKKVAFATKDAVLISRPSSFSKDNAKRNASPGPSNRLYGGYSASSDEGQNEMLGDFSKIKPRLPGILCTPKHRNECHPPTDEDIRAFEIGANEALQRLKLWKGAPNSLHFFTTCLDISSRDAGSKEWQDLDKQLEHEIIRWIRRGSKKRINRNRSTIKQESNLFEASGELMCWEKLRELCALHGSGKMKSDVLRKVTNAMDEKCHQLRDEINSVKWEQQNISP